MLSTKNFKPVDRLDTVLYKFNLNSVQGYNIESFKIKRFFIFGLALLLFLKGIFPSLVHEPPQVNLYLLQAQAFLEGHWDIKQKVHDVALYKNHYFVAFPPFPALLLTPFVWIFGASQTNVPLISLILAFITGWLLFQILRMQEVDIDTALWTLMGFMMGTAYWMAVKASFGVWYFSHIVSITALFLAIYEAFRRGRGWLIGLCFGAAILSRHLTIYALPFLACALWKNKQKFGSLIGLFTGTIGAVVVYLGINWIRFEDPLSTGYLYILQTGYLKERLDTFGLFNIDYVPFNFTYLFMQGFHVEFKGNGLLDMHCLDPFGTSLTFSSPFLFAAFWAKWKKSLLVSGWISIAAMIIHSLFYYSNGFYQINAQRFTLDFMPILIILAGIGAQQCNAKIWKPLILYAIALNELASIICTLSSPP